MALGRIAVHAIAAPDTNETLFDFSADSVVDLEVVNTNSADKTIRVAIIDGAIGALATEDYVYYDMTIPGTADTTKKNTKALLLREAISANELIMVRANATGVVFRLSGEGA